MNNAKPTPADVERAEAIVAHLRKELPKSAVDPIMLNIEQAIADGRAEKVALAMPSEADCAEAALAICLSEPERVNQQFACENVTRKLYEWLRSRIEARPVAVVSEEIFIDVDKWARERISERTQEQWADLGNIHQAVLTIALGIIVRFRKANETITVPK